MKAVFYDRYGGPEVLTYGELPDPVPGPGEVLIRVRAASVIPADWKLRAGHLRRHFQVPFPKVPGRDGAGEVVGLGAGVADVAPGAPVCFVAGHGEQGSHAELIVRKAAEVAPMPAALSFVEAAALLHSGICAWIGLVEAGRIESGMSVLVHGGAGAIGSMSVQLAKQFGARIAATCRAANRDFVRDLGALAVFAYDEEDFSTKLQDVDLVYDLVGGETHAKSYAVLKKGGRLVYLVAAPIEERGTEHGVEVVRAEIRDDVAVIRRVLELAEAGAWRAQVSRVMPLAEAAEAQRILEAGENTRGRLVLSIED